MATAYQIRLAQAAGDLDEDKLKKLGIAQLNSQLSNANSATAQATAAAVKQATNPTAAQAGIKGAAGVGATVAGAIPMANTPNLPVNPNTPEQKYLANYMGSAGASGTTATAQPTQQKDYLFFGSQDPNFKLGMSDEDRASWDAIGKKYASGDSSWNRDANSFREDGNWSGYYDDAGNYNGWLRAVDGTGGYTPAFGGKVGETGYSAGAAFYAPDGTVYTVGSDGSLAKSGNATTVKYGSYIGPKSGYQDSEFWALNGDGQYQRYTNQTAPADVLEAQGYYRDQNGLVMPIGDEYYIAKGIQNGQITPEQAELAKLARSAGNDTAKTAQAVAAYTGNEAAPKPVQTVPQNVQPSTQTSGSASRSSTTRETTPTTVTPTVTPTTVTPTVTPQQTQPAQTQYTPPAENAYQKYLDQWEYKQAPEWTGGQDETYKDLQNYDYGQAPEWNENPPETWRDMQNYDYGQAPEYQGSPYDQQRDDALAAAGEKWNGSEYQQKRDDALARAENMQWNYDPNTDPVWQALQKQYRREGDRATQEALAQASMRTGGLANSYAVTAASQAGDYYAAQLSDRLPQVYQDAYQRYLQEFQRQMGISDQYQGFDDREYSRWADQQGRNFDLADRYNQYGQQDYNKYQDTLDQYNRDRNFQYGVNRDAVSDELNNYGIRYNQYQDRLGQYNTDRNFQYGVNRDRVSDAERANQTAYSRYLDSLDQYNRDRAMSYEQYRDAVGDARYADETAYNRAWNEENRDYSRNYQAQRDAISDQRYDQQWAQSLREYADAQGWKQAEWEQYLREYGDQLSEKERQWAYQMSRDAISDNRWERQYADQRNDTMYERALYDQEYADQRGDTTWEQNYKQTAYNDALEAAALDYLNTNGIVTGRYAEILGVPDGTTYEQYYSRYLGGGSSSPFEVTEIPAGKTPGYSGDGGGGNPGYTPPPPGGGDEGGGDETPNDPEYQKIRSRYGEDTAMEVWSLAGQPWYSDLKTLAGRDSAAALDQIYSRYEAGEISENALEPLLDMLGLNMSSVTYKPSYRVTTVKGNRNGGSKGNNIQDIDNVRGR